MRALAESLGLLVAVPETGDEVREALHAAGPLDLGVVVAYGRILRTDALNVPSRGMLNLHFSLLPRWRGAAPVSRALMAGDPMTGVTIFKIDEGLDTGPVGAPSRYPLIGPVLTFFLPESAVAYDPTTSTASAPAASKAKAVVRPRMREPPLSVDR